MPANPIPTSSRDQARPLVGRLAALLTVLVLTVTTTAHMPAAASVLTFSGGGVTTFTGNTGGVRGLELSVTDAPYTFTPQGGSAETDWLQDSTFIVNGLADNMPGTSFGHATYSNSLGDSLELDFDGAPVGGGPDFVVMHLVYDIVGGTGRFAASKGGGFEDVTIFFGPGGTFNFEGRGALFLPEPTGAALLLAGLLALSRLRSPRARA